ncbi:Uncharacterised protein [Yersinia aldovae]|uniref:Uncharacterized protein n=1 Tax=Yersinia aldovae TaxID=29483 RepID=A0ABM9SY39_YERAL|nr:Uncharacterised protein [Yersinia aldovae]CNL71557.1 Uncharacterised protein [Yersinia aldovae]
MSAGGAGRKHSAKLVIMNIGISFVSIMPASHMTGGIIGMVKVGELEGVTFSQQAIFVIATFHQPLALSRSDQLNQGQLLLLIAQFKRITHTMLNAGKLLINRITKTNLVTKTVADCR